MAFALKNEFLIFMLIVSGALASAMSRILDQTVLVEKYKQWMVQHGRTYAITEEENRRFQIFKNNLDYLENFNNMGNQTYRLSSNEFADLGSCWAFSTVAAVERLKLVSCSHSQSSNWWMRQNQKKVMAAKGGWMDDAFEYIVKNQGLRKETKYPYTAKDGRCRHGKAAIREVQINGYEDVPHNNEEALLKAASQQPVSVALDGGGYGFQFYSQRVFTGPCRTSLNNAVTIVGYGTSEDGIKYWLSKNSWGKSWGESGYMRIKRDVQSKQGLCGIAKKPSYPEL